MSTCLVSDKELEDYVTGRLDPAAFRQLSRHLAAGCDRCDERLAPFVEALFEKPLPDEPDEDDDDDDGGEGPSVYDEAIERAIRSVLREAPRLHRRKKRVSNLLSIVLAAPVDSDGRLNLAGIRPRLRPSGELMEALIAASQEMRFRDRKKMLDYAFLAQVGAHNLGDEDGPRALRADLEARAWGELGNAYRLNDRFEAAEMALSSAAVLLDQGSGDILLLGHLLDLQASLRSSQRRLPEALELLGHAERYYREAGDLHLAGKALIQKGINTFYEGRAAEAVTLIRQGLAQLEPGRDPRLLALGQHDLLNALVECGDYREAGEMLLSSGLGQAFAEDPVNLLRLRWVEGRIFAGKEKLGRAEGILQEVRDGFQARGMEYDAALVGLELAGVWLQQGDKAAAVRDLAQEVREIFEDLAVQGEALRAVRHLEAACRNEEATPSLTQKIVIFLRRLEWQPQLRFAA